jgi:hypothetical protein
MVDMLFFQALMAYSTPLIFPACCSTTGVPDECPGRYSTAGGTQPLCTRDILESGSYQQFEKVRVEERSGARQGKARQFRKVVLSFFKPGSGKCYPSI